MLRSLFRGRIRQFATGRVIRSIGLGRHDWLFFGRDCGGTTAAVLRSFLASRQRAGVDPFAWFKNLHSRIRAYPSLGPPHFSRTTGRPPRLNQNLELQRMSPPCSALEILSPLRYDSV
jgi:hypothetical protein